MKYLILTLTVLVSACSVVDIGDPVKIKTKKKLSSECKYYVYDSVLDDVYFFAPCDKFLVGDTLQ